MGRRAFPTDPPSTSASVSSDLTFTHPEWLPLLLIAPLLLLGKWWADHRGRRALEAFTAPRLRQQLVAGVSPLRSWTAFLLQLSALCLLILAACGPRWGEEEQPQIETGRNVIIAIDSSRSMLADDLVPDRLTRAKLAAQDLLALLAGDRVGLIVFAGNAYLQAPLTTDHAAVTEAIQSIDTFSVPRGGSEIGRAIKLAIESFEKTPARNHGLVLFSDGGEPDPETEEWTRRAAEKNILILSVGVGTKTGSLIPDPDPNRAGDWIRDEQGNAVQTRLDEDLLREIARGTGGRYLPLSGQSIDSTLVNQVLAALERREGETKSTSKPIERFYWPLSLAIVCLIMAWLLRPTSKRAFAAPAPVVALLLLACLPANTDAASLSSLVPDWADTATRKAREAHRAFEREDYEGAMKLYQESLKHQPAVRQQPAIALGLGHAARESQQFDTAVGAFSQALENIDPAVQRSAHQGLGHSLYDQGDRALAKQPRFTIRAWTDSVRHLNAALKLDPDSKELLENRDFVQKRLDELQEQQRQQQQQQSQNGQKNQGKKGEKGDQGQEGQQGDQGQQGQDGQQPGGQEGEDGEEGEGGSGDQQQQKGQGGEQEEGQKPGDLPEGDITADGPNPGDQEGEGQASEGEMNDDERREDTGFSPNEARAFLRTYADDQKAVQFSRQRQQAVKGKDW
jgi:Ca-activated chloride channel homolog